MITAVNGSFLANSEALITRALIGRIPSMAALMLEVLTGRIPMLLRAALEIARNIDVLALSM